MSKLRFGVIGCGNIATRLFVPALKQSDQAELVAVSSRDQQKAEALAQKHGCDVADNYRDLLDRSDIDAVYIATVPVTHESIILEAAECGKHVLCEKPLSISYESTKRIINHCSKHKVRVFEGFMYQFHSQHQRIREIVESGAIGKPILFKAQFGFPPLEDDNFRYKLALGGGALLDAGSYTIHAARSFFQREPVDINASLYKNENEVDIHGVTNLDFGQGQSAQLSFGFDNFYRNSYSVWGTKGYLTLKRAFSMPPTQNPMIILEQNDNYEKIVGEPDDHFIKEIDYFCNCLLDSSDSQQWITDILGQAQVIDQIMKMEFQP